MFCLDIANHLYPHGGIMGIVPSNENQVHFLLSYLNSSLIYFYLKAKASTKRAGYFSLDVGLLSDIPIPKDKILEDKLTKICKSIYNNEDVIDCEKQIDEEIFNFFNIDQDEKRIIKQN